MEGVEGDSGYLSSYDVNHGYGSGRPDGSLNQAHSHLAAENYVDLDNEAEEDVEGDEEGGEGDGGDGDGEVNGLIQQNGGGVFVENVDSDDTDNDDGDGEGEGEGGEDDKRSDGYILHKHHPKKRKLKSLAFSFELVPRVPPAVKPGGRNPLTDWNEQGTFALLDAWGERFLQRGRKSLRSEEWQQVAEKVSRESKIERTDTQCRNRLDTLKKKYKKEKALLEHNQIANSKWVYFKKMDMLMPPTPVQQTKPPQQAKPPQQVALRRGMDTGEYVFVNPTAHLNHANGLDETRDTPGDTDSQDDDDDEDDDLDLLPPKKSKYKGEKANVGSFRLLADSINKFSEIYEKIENNKSKQMMELEKMRMDFHKDLEQQKMQMFNRARDEIAKLRQGQYEENADSAENIRG